MIGIDIVSVPRIERLMDRYGNSFLQKFLNEDEFRLVKTPKNAAGLWALKEAVSKALECGICEKLTFADIIISKTPLGAPQISLSAKSSEIFPAKLHGSISHEKEFAIAVAVSTQS